MIRMWLYIFAKNTVEVMGPFQCVKSTWSCSWCFIYDFNLHKLVKVEYMLNFFTIMKLQVSSFCNKYLGGGIFWGGGILWLCKYFPSLKIFACLFYHLSVNLVWDRYDYWYLPNSGFLFPSFLFIFFNCNYS